MKNRPQVDFMPLLDAAGIPTSEQALAIELAKEVEAAGSLITNDSRMSPFWRLQKALVIKPTLWLLRTFLAGHVLPNLFAATARGYYQDLKAWDVDLERKAATATRGVIEFIKETADTEVTVSAGTRIATERINGVIYTLKVIQTTLIPAGLSSGLILCEATNTGSAWNLPAGYYCILPESVPGIVRVANPVDWVTRYGDEEEDDDALGLRIQNQFSAVSRYHIDAVYRSALASVAGIRADHVFFEHNAPRGPGTANAFVLMEVGETSAPLLEQLNRYLMLEGNHGHGDDVSVMGMPETQHVIRLTLFPRLGLAEEQKAELIPHVTSMVRAAFRETAAFPDITRTWPQSRFSFSRLAAELHQHAPELQSLDFEQSDIISGLAIPRLSVLEVVLA